MNTAKGAAAAAAATATTATATATTTTATTTLIKTTTTITKTEAAATTILLITPVNEDARKTILKNELDSIKSSHDTVTHSIHDAIHAMKASETGAGAGTTNKRSTKEKDPIMIQILKERERKQYNLYMKNVQTITNLFNLARKHIIHVSKHQKKEEGTKEGIIPVGGYYILKSLEKDYGISSSSNSSSKSSSHESFLNVNDITMSLFQKYYPTTNINNTLRIVIPGCGFLGLMHSMLSWIYNLEGTEKTTTATTFDNVIIDGYDTSLSCLVLGTGMLSLLHTNQKTNRSHDKVEEDSSFIIYPQASLTSCIDIPSKPVMLLPSLSSSSSTRKTKKNISVRLFHQEFPNSCSSLTPNIIVTQYFIDVVDNIINIIDTIIKQLMTNGKTRSTPLPFTLKY
jgi:hypothetical protein